MTTTGMLVTTAATTALSAGMSMLGQQQQAKQQAAYQNALSIQRQQQIDANTGLANASAATEQAQVNQQLVEKREQASQELQENQIQAMKARASARVSSGEAGVSGISIDSLINDFSRKEGRFSDSVRQNLEGFEQNAGARKDAIEAKRQSRVQAMQPYIPAPTSGPDYFGAIAQVGGSAAQWWLKDQQARRSALANTRPENWRRKDTPPRR